MMRSQFRGAFWAGVLSGSALFNGTVAEEKQLSKRVMRPADYLMARKPSKQTHLITLITSTKPARSKSSR